MKNVVEEYPLLYSFATEIAFYTMTGVNILLYDTENPMFRYYAILSAHAAYCEKNNIEEKVSKDILFSFSPKDILDLFTEFAKLQAEWYNIPFPVKEVKETGKKKKKMSLTSTK